MVPVLLWTLVAVPARALGDDSAGDASSALVSHETDDLDRGAGDFDDDSDDGSDDDADDDGLGAGGELAWLSRYLWRGIALSDTAVLQPTAWVSYSVFTLWTFANIDLPNRGVRGDLGEVDLGLDIGYEVGPVDFEAGFVGYFYPTDSDAPTTGEVTLNVGWTVGLVRLSTTHALDVVEYSGAYAGDLGVGVEITWERGSVDVRLAVGLANETFMEANVGAGGGGVLALTLDVGLPIELGGGFFCRPMLSAAVFLQDAVAEALEERVVFESGFAVGYEY